MKNISASHISDEGQVSVIVENFYHSIIKRQLDFKMDKGL